MDNDSLDSARYRSQDLIWDSAKYGSEIGYLRVFAEDGDGIPYLRIGSCYIEHTHIHAYVSYSRHSMTIYSEIPLAAAEMTIDSVCISYRNGGDDSTLGRNPAMTAISDRTVFRL